LVDTHGLSLAATRGFSVQARTSQQEKGLRAAPATNYDERLDKRVWPIAASSLMTGTAIGVILPVMPLYAQDMGITPSEFGIVIGVMGLTRLILNVPLAFAADKIGRKPLLVGGAALSSVGMLYTGFANSFGDLVAGRFITGAGGGAQQTGSQLYLSDISNPSNRARTMAPLGIAFGVGAAIGPGIGGWVADQYGMNAPFFFVGSLIAGAAVTNFVMLPETFRPPTSKQASKSEGDQTDGQHEKSQLWKEFADTSLQWKGLMANSNIRATLVVYCTFWVTMSGSRFALLPLFCSENFAMSASDLGGLYAMMACISVLLMQPSAWLADKWGPTRVIVPAAALIALSVGLIPFAQDTQQLTGILVAWAAGSALVGSAPTAFVVDSTTEETRSQALGLVSV
jgi:MFS family permease